MLAYACSALFHLVVQLPISYINSKINAPYALIEFALRIRQHHAWLGNCRKTLSPPKKRQRGEALKETKKTNKQYPPFHGFTMAGQGRTETG